MEDYAAPLKVEATFKTGMVSSRISRRWPMIPENVQVVHPAQKIRLDNGHAVNTATVLGLRLRLVF
jgi:hypothetical protein